MPIVVDVKLSGVEGLSKSQLNAAMKKANVALGLGFRRRYLPDRFTVKGGHRLKYTPRSGENYVGYPSGSRKDRQKYAPRKERWVGHSIPLVLTGEGKRQALQDQRVFSTRDTIRIPLPRKFNWRHPKSRVRMADEIRAISRSEVKRLTAELIDHIERELAFAAGAPQTRGRVASAAISQL